MNRLHLTLLVLGLTAWYSHADELLLQPDISTWVDATLPAGVTITASTNSEGTVLRVSNSNEDPVSVILAELPLQGLSDTRLSYEAQVSSEDLTAPTYLEMWGVLGDNAYFSRALDDRFTGTQSERFTSTPFFLKPENVLDVVRLGLRFEGTGTVTIRDVTLRKRNLVGGAGDETVAGIAGSLFGIGSGIWACVVGLLAWKGMGRNGVLGVTLGLMAASLIALAAGFALWTQGSAWAIWYPVVLLGLIGLINFGAAYFVLRWWYGKTEARRMAAMDMG